MPAVRCCDPASASVNGEQGSVLHLAVRVSPEKAWVVKTTQAIGRNLSHCPIP